VQQKKTKENVLHTRKYQRASGHRNQIINRQLVTNPNNISLICKLIYNANYTPAFKGEPLTKTNQTDEDINF
jgi:hypothetical protein